MEGRERRRSGKEKCKKVGLGGCMRGYEGYLEDR